VEKLAQTISQQVNNPRNEDEICIVITGQKQVGDFSINADRFPFAHQAQPTDSSFKQISDFEMRG